MSCPRDVVAHFSDGVHDYVLLSIILFSTINSCNMTPHWKAASFPVLLKVIKFLIFFVLAFFQCYVCHASVTVEIDRGRISEPALCRNCNTNHSMVLIHNRSQYTDKQITKLQESPGCLLLLSFSLWMLCPVCLDGWRTFLWISFCIFLFSLDDMPPGQTPHTIMLFSHNDLVDAVQPGDRYILFLIILLESRLHTVWHKIFVGSNFCDFSSSPQK